MIFLFLLLDLKGIFVKKLIIFLCLVSPFSSASSIVGDILLHGNIATIQGFQFESEAERRDLIEQHSYNLLTFQVELLRGNRAGYIGTKGQRATYRESSYGDSLSILNVSRGRTCLYDSGVRIYNEGLGQYVEGCYTTITKINIDLGSPDLLNTSLTDVTYSDLLGLKGDSPLGVYSSNVHISVSYVRDYGYYFPYTDEGAFNVEVLGSINFDGIVDDVTLTYVSEPSAFALLGLGIMGLSIVRRKTKK